MAKKRRKLEDEIGTIDFCTFSTRYMKDGTVLIGRGYGWELFSTVKDGIDPRDAYIERVAMLKSHRESHIDYDNYVKYLHKLAPASKRLGLHNAIKFANNSGYIEDKPNYVWKICCCGESQFGQVMEFGKGNVKASLDEIKKLYNLWDIIDEKW
jgi:hypothetical protein